MFKKIIKKIKSWRIFHIKGVVAFNFKKPKKMAFIKYGCCFAIPMCAAIVGATLGIVEHNRRMTPLEQVIIETNKVTRRVYLISNDDLTVPLTVSLNQKNSIQEEILDTFNLLRTDSKAANEYLHGFIPEDAKVNSFTIENNILLLDMSEEFLNYQEKNEVKMVEALLATMLQFDEIDGMILSVNGTILSSLPNNHTPLPSILDENFGLNRVNQSPREIIGKEKVTLFYERSYDQETKYLVPVTFYSEKMESLNVSFANALSYTLPVASRLKNVATYKQISALQEANDDFILSVNNSALIDEETVNKELYELVALSLDLMGVTKPISFTLEGETLAVDGIYQEDDMKVSNIVYNSVEI